MLRTAIFLITVFYFSLTFSQTINHKVKYDNGKDKLLGLINKEGLTQIPFNDWFSKNYDEYLVNTKVVEKLKDSLKNYEIKVFLGTWCGDSKREVPRFYNVLEVANFPKNQLEVIAVDNEKEAYKQSPNGEEKGLNIHRVPTFIFYKDGKEINRIVEYPRETLERDILKITTGKNYKPSYIAANYLNSLFETKTTEELWNMQSELVPRVSQALKGISELNTYGNVLISSNQLEKALYVFDINTRIFPYHYYVFNSLGKSHFEAKNYTEALKNYNKALELKPTERKTKLMIEKIKSRM